MSEPVPILVTLPAPRPINVSFQPAPRITVQVALSAPGVKGETGSAGPRGSLFLGAYPTFANLPAIDGVGVAIGDYALVQDTSTMYQIR